MGFRYQLDNRYGKQKITCPSCNHSNTFTRFYDTVSGKILGDEYGMCDRAINCSYVNRPPKNYDTDEDSEYAPQPRSIYDTEFIRENWIPKNGGVNNNLTKGLVELFGEERVLPVIKEYNITDFYDGGTIYPYMISGNLISGKIIFYDDNLKRLKDTKTPDAMWIHSYLYGDNGGNYHRSKEEHKWIKKVYPLFGWDLIDKNPDKFICVVEGEKTAIICSIVMPEYVWVAVGALKWLQSYKFPEHNSRVWLFFPDLEPKQDGKNYWDYWENQIKKIQKESYFKLKYALMLDYTSNRTEQSFL